jgi:NtrC-family two-component system response regulator AlgB
MTNAPHCLIVDDEVSIRKTLAWTLESSGWETLACGDPASALAAAQAQRFDLALLDLRLGTRSGLDLLPQLLQAQPELPVVMITAYGSIPGAVEALRRGALDYLPKPFTPDEVRQAAAQALQARPRQDAGLASAEPLPMMTSRSPVMQKLLAQAKQIALNPRTPLLLSGEVGSGKGRLARAVHAWSPRRDRPFVAVACPPAPAPLLESELFGHRAGAAGDAGLPGRLAEADGGTLFLNEVGLLSLELQAKLLRFLQEGDYVPVNGGQPLRADVRILAASQVDLARAVREGRFRQDLYFRLNVVELVLPPLRDRLEDLEDLVESFLLELAQRNGDRPQALTAAALARLRAYRWPGNLRELRQALERASASRPQDPISAESLAFLPMAAEATSKEDPALKSLGDLELEHIRQVLRQAPSLEQAAHILGMHPTTLWRKRRRHKL